MCSTRNVELVRSLGADHVIDYTRQDFTDGERRYDVILDNVMNHPPPATARALTPTGRLIPNSVGNSRGFFAGLPRSARAALLGRGSTRVRFVTCEVSRENLDALATLLESGDVRPVIDTTYPLSEAADAVARMLTHHARGNVVISLPDAAHRADARPRHGTVLERASFMDPRRRRARGVSVSLVDQGQAVRVG